jgi:hypothetical protein
MGHGMARNKQVIWVGCEAKYFSKQGWTGQITLIAQSNFRFKRNRNTGYLGQAEASHSGYCEGQASQNPWVWLASV